MKTTTKIIAMALLAVMCFALLVSCAPNSDPAKAVEALKENGYENATKDPIGLKTTLSLAGIEDVYATVTASKKTEDGKKLSITIIYFPTKDAAAKEFDDIEDYAEEFSDAEDYVVEQSGAIVYYGNKQAAKDAR